MNSNIRWGRDDSNHNSRHRQTHDDSEQSDANVREDVGTNEGEGGEGRREVRPEAEGNGISTIWNLRPSQPVRRPYYRRGSTRNATRFTTLSTSRGRDDSSHHSRHGQIHDKRSDPNVCGDVDDRGADEREGGEGKNEVRPEAEGNGISTTRNLRTSQPMRRPYYRRGFIRNAARPTKHSRRQDDSDHHSRHGQIHDKRSDPNICEDVDDEGANDGEREVNEAEGNSPSANPSLRPSNSGKNSIANEGEPEGGKGEREVKEAEDITNQGLRPSNSVHRSYYRRESSRDAILRLEGTLRRRERDVTVLSTRNEQLTDEIRILEEKLARLQLEQDQTKQLLHEKTIKLSNAQLFLDSEKADTIFAIDVSRMVDLLNAEISQASNSIADSLYDHQVALATSDITLTELNRLLQKERSSIGAGLCDILARRLCQPSTDHDPMITQLALQAGLTKACYLIINDWNPPFWDSSSTINRTYTNMRLSVGQFTAGRWRSLTHTYINGQGSEDGVQEAEEEIRKANANYLRSTLRDLLTVVGWSPRIPNQELPFEYYEKMRFLSDKALKLHEAIGQRITSKDLIVDIIPCETPFDPTQMDDANRQRGKPDAIPNDTVACTVELGLKYKSAKLGGDSEETGVILKPKVLLASVLVGD